MKLVEFEEKRPDWAMKIKLRPRLLDFREWYDEERKTFYMGTVIKDTLTFHGIYRYMEDGGEVGECQVYNGQQHGLVRIINHKGDWSEGFRKRSARVGENRYFRQDGTAMVGQLPL